MITAGASSSSTAEDLVGTARFSVRTAAFVGLTFSLYGLLELETAARPPEARGEVLHRWMRRYGEGLLKLYGVEAVTGGPYLGQGEQHPGTDARGKGRVFVMNHRSGLDVPITLAFFECTIMSRADLSAWPVIGVAARRVGTLFVDRASKRSGAAVIHAASLALDAGRGVMVYPEGTTYAGDEVRPFRAGAFHAAQRSAAEVVPVGIAYGGASASYVDESFTSHMRRVSSTKRTPVALEVGEPIASAGKTVEALQKEAHAAVQALVLRARAALG